MDNNLLIAFILTLLAGLSTAVGGALSFFVKKDNMKVLSVGLGFSAGVMIYISLVEILPEASHLLAKNMDPKMAGWIAIAAFFVGILTAGLIDFFLPDHIDERLLKDGDKKDVNLKKVGIFTALAVTIHNFPEGLATFITGLNDLTLAYPIAFAIAIHNIPEGIAVALPVYYSTKSRRKAFFYSFLSGLAEPVGAIVGYMFLSYLFNDLAFGVIYGLIAGIMIYISIDELIPTSIHYNNGHSEVISVVVGMLIMAVSLNLF